MFTWNIKPGRKKLWYPNRKLNHHCAFNWHYQTNLTNNLRIYLINNPNMNTFHEQTSSPLISQESTSKTIKQIRKRTWVSGKKKKKDVDFECFCGGWEGREKRDFSLFFSSVLISAERKVFFNSLMTMEHVLGLRRDSG